MATSHPCIHRATTSVLVAVALDQRGDPGAGGPLRLGPQLRPGSTRPGRRSHRRLRIRGEHATHQPRPGAVLSRGAGAGLGSWPSLSAAAPAGPPGARRPPGPPGPPGPAGPAWSEPPRRAPGPEDGSPPEWPGEGRWERPVRPDLPGSAGAAGPPGRAGADGVSGFQDRHGQAGRRRPGKATAGEGVSPCGARSPWAAESCPIPILPRPGPRRIPMVVALSGPLPVSSEAGGHGWMATVKNTGFASADRRRGPLLSCLGCGKFQWRPQRRGSRR